MRKINIIIKYTAFFLLAGFIANYFQITLLEIYKYLLPKEIGGGFDISFDGLVAIDYGFEFLYLFLILTFGDGIRYRVALLVTALILALEFLIDSHHILTPAFLILFGALLGWLLRTLATHTLGKIPSLEPYKKYF